MHGSTDSVVVFIKAKDNQDLEHTLEGITQTAANTRVDLIKDSGIFTTPAKENFRKSLLLVFWIYVSTFVGSSTISGYLEKVDLGSSSWYHQLIALLIKAALVAIPPSIVAFALVQ